MIGHVISHYRIIEEIGRGGMGTVYKAEDTRLKRTVALKFLPPELTRDEEAKKRFYREAQAASALQHQNVCAIHDIEETPDGQVFICLDYYTGLTLKEMLAALPLRSLLPVDEVVAMARQIAAGLLKAHQLGIIHRDIKPANIIITTEGVVKILDFGLSTLASGSRLTRTGKVSGTAAYMSPEQATGGKTDRRTDLWSFGVVVYEMLAGRHPFEAEYEQAAIYQILNQDAEPLAMIRGGLSEALLRLVNGCLQRNKDKRIQDVREVLSLLDEATQPAGAAGQKKGFPKKTATAAAAGLAIAIIVGAFSLFRKTPALPDNARTVAVLPFIDLDNNPNNAYFSDGVTEDILTQLSRISGLRVLSRTTMMQYKGSKKKLSEIGAELKAGVVLEGSVRRSGSRVRITAQLIDAQKDAHLWADSYDREMSDILGIQSDVAAKIAAALKVALTPREKEVLKKAPAVNPQVYTLLLQSRYFIQRVTKEDTEKAISLLEQALAIDDANAQVWAALALAHFHKAGAFYEQSINVKEEWAKMQQEAEKAAALDDDCVEAHTILGTILSSIWDWQGAETEFKRAFELDPNSARGVGGMARFAKTQGRLDEALTLFRRVVELEPINPSSHLLYGQILMVANRFDEALASVQKALELSPRMVGAHLRLGMIFVLQGKSEKALEEMRLEPDPCGRIYGLALAFTALGREKEANAALAEMISKYKEWAIFQIAEIYAWQGHADKAFEYLEEAFRMREPALEMVKTSPWLMRLKSDPRYIPFLNKMNLVL